MNNFVACCYDSLLPDCSIVVHNISFVCLFLLLFIILFGSKRGKRDLKCWTETSACIQISAAVLTLTIKVKIHDMNHSLVLILPSTGKKSPTRSLYIHCAYPSQLAAAKISNNFITPWAAKSKTKYLCQSYNRTLLWDIIVTFLLKMLNCIT